MTAHRPTGVPSDQDVARLARLIGENIAAALYAAATTRPDPIERLFAEELPGSTSDYRHHREPITPAQAAANYALLEAACRRPLRHPRRRTP